jgi:NADPH:quinone reductase-like Zn-dependent oxidoreductase/NAD(P)-dependent dehydrogenase (short-subunit alcohol dehydrogenase family)/acyl carrier protein
VCARITGADAADVTLRGGDGAVLVHIEGLAMVPLKGGDRKPWCGHSQWVEVPATASETVNARVRGIGSNAPELIAKLRDVLSNEDPEAPLAVLFAPDPHEEPACLAELASVVSQRPQGSRLILATCGTMAPRGLTDRLSEAGAGLWGLARTLAQERADLDLRVVDLDPDGDVAVALSSECADAGAETATAWRAGRRYGERLCTIDAAMPARPSCLSPAQRPPVFVEAPRMSPAAGDVEIEVSVAALNFRDAMVASGATAATDGFGSECAGRILKVGGGVAGFAEGDAVLAYVPDGAGSIRTHLTVSARFVRLRPAGLSQMCAGSGLLSAMVARRAMIDLGLARDGETALVHQAGSAVGLAALALARRHGMTVHATAHPDKHALLRSLGAASVVHSRESFADAVLEATADRGVDLAIGAFANLADEARRVLGPNGRLIDLTNGPDNPSLVDIDKLARSEPELFASLMDEAIADLQSAEFVLPVDAVPAGGAGAALEELKRGSAVGRKAILLDASVRAWNKVLVTGACGGVGREIARYLVKEGVSRLVLVDLAKPEPGFLEALEEGGTAVEMHCADVTDPQAMRHVLEAGEPVDAVVHTAAVLADAPLGELDAEAFEKVFAVKVAGANVLDQLTRHTGIENFILFSSVTAHLPSSGQGAYAAANAALGLIARRRRAAGYHATCQAWGPWSVGIGARLGERAQEAWRRFGVEPMTPDAAAGAFAQLAPFTFDPLVIDIDWPAYAGAAHPPRLLANLVGQSPDGEPEPGSARGPDRRSERSIREIVDDRLRAVLRMPPDQEIDPARPFRELGLDSLMATEFADALSRDLGRRVPATLVYNHPSTSDVVTFLVQSFNGAAPSGPAQPSGPQSLSEEDVPDRTAGGDTDPLGRLEQKLAEVERLLEKES